MVDLELSFIYLCFRMLSTTSSDRSIRLWEMEKLTLSMKLTGHEVLNVLFLIKHRKMYGIVVFLVIAEILFPVCYFILSYLSW